MQLFFGSETREAACPDPQITDMQILAFNSENVRLGELWLRDVQDAQLSRRSQLLVRYIINQLDER